MLSLIVQTIIITHKLQVQIQMVMVYLTSLIQMLITMVFMISLKMVTVPQILITMVLQMLQMAKMQALMVFRMMQKILLNQVLRHSHQIRTQMVFLTLQIQMQTTMVLQIILKVKQLQDIKLQDFLMMQIIMEQTIIMILMERQ